MGQYHGTQFGIFHVITNTKGRVHWCTLPGVPRIIIRDLSIAKALCGMKIFAFCILPDHLHLLIEPNQKGLSKFMKSFKENSSRNIRNLLTMPCRNGDDVVAVTGSDTTTVAPTAVVTASAFIATTRPTIGINHENDTPLSGWQKGFFDERIRDMTQFQKALLYIQNNAQHHSLVNAKTLWPWSSLVFPNVIDPLRHDRLRSASHAPSSAG